MTMSNSVDATRYLDDVLTTEAFGDVIDIAEDLVLNVGESIKTIVESEFKVENLFIAKPVLLSRLKHPNGYELFFIWANPGLFFIYFGPFLIPIIQIEKA